MSCLQGIARPASLVLVIAALLASSLAAQEVSDEEAARLQQVAARFVAVLEKNPRRGTALDKVYGFHVENGSLETFVATYRDRAAKDSKDGSAAIVLGLLESLRGRDAAAVEAFTQAAAAMPQNHLPAFYLGQSLVLVGQPDKAVEAFEQAIARNPPQADALEIFQALGRVHQRAQRFPEALAVWSRLQKLFPNDARVQEQIAAAMIEEGQHAQALPRYEALIELTKDDYRKSIYRIEAAELKVKLNRSAEGVADLERLLASLNPTSWLHRDVRRKIEEVFLRTDDQDGLARYYEAWIRKNPEDVDAMARLARVLARQARVPEAQEWLDKALKLAPSRKELRRAFIEQLVDDQRYPEAIKQYELLDKADPNNPDVLREWGKLILRDTSRAKPERLAAAEQVWRKLLAARPTDPLAATQVADLLRHSENSKAALELYEKAVQLAPDQPQYREYLGEYYHQLKQPEEALATWRKIAEGKNRTAANLARLAEVFASFGYLQVALPEMAAACQLEPKDFALQVKSADLLEKVEQHTEALAALNRAAKLAQNDEEREAVLAMQLRVYEAEGTLARRTTELADAVKAAAPSARELFLLARHHEASRQLPEAAAAISAALKIEPQSIPSLATAARIQEQSGELQAAAELNRRLAAADRRGRSDYLRHVAELEAQLGRIDQALAAGRDLISSAPGNTENYEFFATLCFRLGKSEDGLQALRRAIRLNPGEPQLILTLASALAEQFRTDEAIELYWQAYDKSEALDDKLTVVTKLTELHLQSNHLDQLLDRLERLQRDADDKRESTICLSQAYHSAGDYGMARQELERLLSENTRDTQLLQQLSKLAETEGDLAGAVKYQEQLAKLAPGPETEYRLATLLAAAGAAQESAAILVRLATREEDTEKLLRTIDALLGSQQYETALLILESKLREEPKNWELLYREGVALAKSQAEEAARRFQQILELPTSDSEPGISEKNRRAKEAKTAAASSTSGRAQATRQLNRTDYSYQAREAIGLSTEGYYGGSRRAVWTPGEYSEARMASIGWLYRFARDEKRADKFMEVYKSAAEDERATPRSQWDHIYLLAMTGAMDSTSGYEGFWPAARRLALQGDLHGQYLFTTLLIYRQPEYRGQRGQAEPPPLTAEDVDLALRSFEAIRKWAQSSAGGDEMVSYMANSVMHELKRAGRTEDEQRLFAELMSAVKTPDQMIYAISAYAARDDYASLLAAFDKWAQLTLQDKRKAVPSHYRQQVGRSISQAIGRSGADMKNADVLALLDRFLDFNAERSARERQKTTHRPGRSSTVRGYYYYNIWYGSQQRGMQVNYPLPNDYYDEAALNVLRNAYEVFSQNDLASDLTRHLAERLEGAPPQDRLCRHLAAAYVAAWSEDKVTATQHLTAASELAPQDWLLRLEVARFHVEMQDYEQALAIADDIHPLDQDTLRERETLALNLAVRMGDQERARSSAERLFGLRLDAETQIQLASQMRRLGMNEQAEAVLARAQRQAGSRLTALVSLMSAHQSQGKAEIAAEIAYQVLRRSRSGTSPAASGMRSASGDEGPRRAALQVLAAAGKLKEMIAATEKQLERSPQSSQLFDTLAEYYEAAGDAEKSLALQKKLVAERPTDAELGNRYAQRLAASGKYAEACDQYLVVIKQSPQMFGNRSYEIIQVFQQAKRQADLIALFNEVDLRQLGHPYYLANFVQTLMRDKAQRPAAIGLFKKVWEAAPDYRSNLASSMNEDGLLETDELFDLAKKSILPAPGTLTQQGLWVGLSESNSISSGGESHSLFQRVVAEAQKTNRLPALREEIAAAVNAHPTWKAGPLMACAIDVRLGKLDGVRPVVEQALAEKGDAAIPYYPRWILGQFLEANEALSDLAIRLYEGTLTDEAYSRSYEFEFSPAVRLLNLYVAAGRREDARQLIRKAEKQRLQDGYDPAYAAERRVSQLAGLAQQYDRLDYPADALRLYRDTLLAAQSPALGARRGNNDYYTRNAEQQLKALTARLGASENPDLLEQLLAPRDEPGQPVVDLMIGVQRDSAGGPQITSPLVELLMSQQLSPSNQAAMAQQVELLQAKYSGDLSLQMIAALCSLRDKDPERMAASLVSLRAAVEQNPLEELPPGKRANSRQREAALPQVALWLVAAECLKAPGQRDIAGILAERATQAARRQSDPQFVTAILVQRSKLALAVGEKPAAQEHLTELLEIALTRPQAKAKTTNSAQPQSAQPAGPAKPNLTPPLTLSQFRLAMTACQLAAENDMPELAARAVSQSLAGGLPVSDVTEAIGSASPRVIRTYTGEEVSGEEGEIGRLVATELTKLAQTWRFKGYLPQLMRDALHGVVFPKQQPGLVLLYPQQSDAWYRPSSLGLELVRFTVATGEADTLAKELQQHRSKPAAELAAAALEVMLAVEQKQFAGATEPLELIAKKVEQPRAGAASIAAQAAALAFAHDELAPAALPILEALAKSSSNATPSTRLLDKLGGHYAKARQPDKLRSLYSHYLDSRLAYYARYGDPDYAIRQQVSDLATATTGVSRAGDVRLTLEFLGRVTDLPTTTSQGGAPPLWDIDWQVRSLPAAERYALLKEWTLPSEQRRTIRFVVGCSPGLQVPTAFLPEGRKSAAAPPAIGLLSNFTWLVQAASEANQLDDLQAAVDAAIAEKLPHAETLAALVAIRRRDTSARTKVELLAAATTKRLAEPPAKPNERNWEELRWQNVLVLEAALAQPATRNAARAWIPQVLRECRSYTAFDRLTHLGRIIALDSLRDLPADEARRLLTPGLKYWASGTSPDSTATNNTPAWWTACGDTVTHLTGYGDDSLYLNYPLAGTFEFSCEAHSYDFSEAEVAYGGLISFPEFWNNRAQIVPVSRHETITRASTLSARDWWNRYSVQVSPQAIRFFSNGHLVYEESEPSITSPWLHLVALDHRRVAVRRLKITGDPVVPREVRLIAGDRFEGWGGTPYYDRLPRRLTRREPARKLRPGEYADPGDTQPTSWHALDGVLYGVRELTPGERSEARLWYHRPLRSGDSVRYEFLYEPGRTHVHPALGRLVFLLEPGGVRLHWSTDGANPLAIDGQNVIDEPEQRRGPASLPLLANDWNSAEVSMQDHVARLTLNGELVYERPIESSNDLRFGLFHLRDQTDVQVRNVVLTGNWPEKLEPGVLNDLLALESPEENAATSLARYALTREAELADDAYEVWRNAQALSATERYARLCEWVLPGPLHPTYRLQSEFTPTDPPLPAAGGRIAARKVRRGHVGGELVSPAWELVRTAAELKKLDELEAAIRGAAPGAHEATRNVLALEALVAISRGNDPAAAAALQHLHQQLTALDPATPQVDRYPEFLAAWAAVSRPALRKEALPLAELLVENQHSHYLTQDWERRVRWLRAAVRWSKEPQLLALAMRAAPPPEQWAAVSHPTAEQRGRGLPPATWSIAPGKAAFHTGQGNDSLYFQSPLTGNFEVTCLRTTYGWREMRLMYGAVALDVHHLGKSLLRVPLARGQTEIPLAAPIEKWGEKVEYRLAVNDGQMTAFVNGKQVHAERMAAGADPWLAIQTAAPHFNGSVENLRITGSPTIPDEIDVTASPDLTSWRADYYGDSIDAPAAQPAGGTLALWTRQKDEIVGNLHEAAPGSLRESVLHYHRPLLEDGELSYEFFYEPGKTEVHPALDRAALLVGPDGVKFHYLTDAAYERSGIDPANAAPLPGSSASPPLKSGDWNQLVLQLEGDEVSLSLNGEPIGRYTLESTNQRLFGLFRYSDATTCRVRNVKYRGSWPKALPERQELAEP